MKKYRTLLLKHPLLEESPAVEMKIDAGSFNHANELAYLMAQAIGYAVEQVSEV